MSHPRVLVIGAGIVGASIAYHLARAGAEVTVVDAASPGGVATAGSWAWINASAGNPEPYVRLRMRSMELWRDLDSSLSGLEVQWGGGLLWDLAPDDLRAYAAEHASWDYPVKLVDRDFVARREPELASPPELAVHVAIEGAVEPIHAATVLLDAAVAFGARVIPGRAALALRAVTGRVTGVQTAGGVVAADEVVIAAGVGTPALLASVGIDL
ncbi:MAG: FAD-binding oxidoreductase, partial [Mesorhizobium sp.]|nr:FAD-binding oxidoreductase [Mesorhizobium sp.]